MGSENHKSTFKTLQFLKFNGANYHVWSDNMQSTLLAKSLWGVVSGNDKCPLKPPNDYPGCFTTMCPTADSPFVVVQKEHQKLYNVMQSKGSVT